MTTFIRAFQKGDAIITLCAMRNITQPPGTLTILVELYHYDWAAEVYQFITASSFRERDTVTVRDAFAWDLAQVLRWARLIAPRTRRRPPHTRYIPEWWPHVTEWTALVGDRIYHLSGVFAFPDDVRDLRLTRYDPDLTLKEMVEQRDWADVEQLGSIVDQDDEALYRRWELFVTSPEQFLLLELVL